MDEELKETENCQERVSKRQTERERRGENHFSKDEQPVGIQYKAVDPKNKYLNKQD